jgi:alkanesulfonate monooxygenase SsuD/methylene tetrahydromethanopterin reductase-like flavin-dependent oxidoreductase (luciferase family)
MMKFGVCITAAPAPAFLNHPAIVEIARKAEAWGYDSIFLTDHYMTPNYVETYAVLPFLSYLAAVTSTMKLGTVVTPIPFRPPGMLAKMISTMDVLSSGRIILGIGAGWCQSEFEAYSQWNEGKIRVRKTLEGLKLMLRLWHEEEVDFNGEYYQAKGDSEASSSALVWDSGGVYVEAHSTVWRRLVTLVHDHSRAIRRKSTNIT